MDDFFSAFRQLIEEEKITQKQAVFFKGQATTYGEMLEEAEKVALALTACGVKKGDVVGIYMGNCTEFLSIFLGIAKCGAVAQPVNILLTEYEVKPQLDQTNPKALFVSAVHLPVVRKLRAHLPQLKDVVLMSGEAAEDVWLYSDLLKNADGPHPSVEIEEDDLLLLLFTAGTTGTPKGVMLSHRNLLSVIEGERNLFRGFGEMVTLCAVPLSHIFGFNTITFASLFRKWPVVLEEWFQVDEAAKLIETYRISHTMCVPTIVRRLVEVADKYDMRSLSLVLCGAAPVPEELYDKVEKTFECIMIQGWGLTEGTGCATATSPGVRKIGSCGIPFEGIDVDCAIFDAEDNEVPTGQVGELVMRGVLNMRGYLGNPWATAEAIRDGWLHTGDLARKDDDGYIYIVDRKKDIIIRGGFNVYPAEVEAVLYTHPNVGEVAVFGVSDRAKGETVAAAVTPKPGAQITEEEIIAYCKERLARFKVPKYVKIMKDSLPKSAAGKILRRVLKSDMEKENRLYS
jgi:long-chain acyl-CoA synthetase